MRARAAASRTLEAYGWLGRAAIGLSLADDERLHVAGVFVYDPPAVHSAAEAHDMESIPAEPPLLRAEVSGTSTVARQVPPVSLSTLRGEAH
jgi:hypothetical protein